MICSSPLSDYKKVLAVNQSICAPGDDLLHVDSVWPITELQIINRETKKIMIEKGAKHLLGSTELLYLPMQKHWKTRNETIIN